jgi:hypothetical protein
MIKITKLKQNKIKNKEEKCNKQNNLVERLIYK